MKKRNSVAHVKAFTLLFCALLLAESTGCASKVADSSQAASSTESEESSKNSQVIEGTSSEQTQESTAVTSEKIRDFDDFVNASYYESAKKITEQKGYINFYPDLESNLQIYDRIVDIFMNTDIKALPKDDDLYKTIFVYNQLTDKNWQESQARNDIIEKLNILESITTQDDIFKIHEDPYFSTLDTGMTRKVIFENSCSINSIFPYTISNTEWTAEQKEALKNILQYFDYDETRADEIVNNAQEINNFIDKYSADLNYDYTEVPYGQEELDNENVSIPVIDILKKTDALGSREFFISHKHYGEFLNDYFAPENVAKVRDSMIAFAAITLSRFIETDNFATYNLFYQTDMNRSFDEAVALTLSATANDTISAEYNSRYVSDKSIENAENLLNTVRSTMLDLISDTEWLSVHGKELAKRKVLHQNYFLAKNTYTDDLSDVTLTDNPIDNYIALRTSQIQFYDKQLKNKDEDFSLYGTNLLETNAYYSPERNSITIFSGELDDEYINSSSFEENLAALGFCEAHEISHGYDPKGSHYDSQGYYEPWMTEEEYNAYCEKADKISAFFDGMEVEYGFSLEGDRVRDEVFSDLMAMECCLRILESRENADYDAFFRAYAKKYACYYTKAGMEYYNTDSHLPGKARINYILGQFDKFYETYDIDPESPYYVPEDKRLSAF